jgi:uncharacterized protein
MDNNVELKLDAKGHGGFYIMDGDEELGEMEITINGDEMVVHHTEVSPKAEGKGLAKKLLAAMTDYARKNALQVIPLCPFVNAQFRRHPQEYQDLWRPPHE